MSNCLYFNCISSFSSDLSILSEAGINFADIEVLSETGINYADVEVLTERGINWSDVTILTERGINWSDIALLSEAGINFYDIKVDRVFIGSCTNGRESDIKAAAEILKGKQVKIPTLISYATEAVQKYAIENGYDSIFREAHADVRLPGCSMCLAMNPDKLIGNERCASTSNRNFKGRQGSKTGRTHLVSPYTAAATAIEGRFADPRNYLK